MCILVKIIALRPFDAQVTINAYKYKASSCFDRVPFPQQLICFPNAFFVHRNGLLTTVK